MSDPADGLQTLTDDEVQTHRFDSGAVASADDAADTADATDDATDTADESGDVSDTGDDSGDVADTSDDSTDGN